MNTAGDREKYRSDDERERVRTLDPVPRLEQRLRDDGAVDDGALAALEAEIAGAIDAAVEVMRSRDLVAPATALEGLFAS